MFRLIVIIIFTGLSFSLRAQEILTPDEAVALALKNNYEILIQKADSSYYALDYKYRDALFYPQINASTGLLLNNNNTKQKLADGTIRKGTGIKSDNISSSINLNWVVFDGLKMFITRNKYAEYVKLGELNIKNQVISSVSDVLKTYYNVVSQKQQLKAIEEQMGINEERVKQADKKLSVGLGAKPELLQAKLDLNAQRAARFTQINNIEQLKEQLNQLIGFKPGSNYDVVDTIIYKPDLAEADVFAAAEQNNPALKVAKQNIRIAEFSLKERKAEQFPRVSLQSAYNFSKLNNNTVVNNFSPLFNRSYGFNYGISINIPILNYLNVRKGIRSAELDVNYQKLLYDYQQTQINTSISSAYKAYQMQLRTLELEEENIKLARENIYIALERNRLGLSTVLELRETQKTLSDAYTRLINARYNTKVAETDLLRLRGDLVQ
jgi:outer membrane protein TolC